MVEDNCSNCESSRVRRTQPFCTNKKSKHYQSITSLSLKCDCYKRGTQVEIISGDGETVIYPKPSE